MQDSAHRWATVIGGKIGHRGEFNTYLYKRKYIANEI